MLPLYIVLCRATFLQVPRELEEAALVDGNSRVGAFLRIMLPLARNGILVSSILIFLQSFGEYVYARSLIAERANCSRRRSGCSPSWGRTPTNGTAS